MRRYKARVRIVWQPTREQVQTVVGQFFTKAPKDFYVIRARTVGTAVAAALGVAWSPALAQIVADAVKAFGGKSITFNHVHLFAGIVPRHFDEAEALELSMRLRCRKNPPKKAVAA